MRGFVWVALVALGGCDVAPAEDLDALTARVEDLEEDRDALQALVDTLRTDVDAIAADTVLVDVAMTIHVPADQPTLDAALDSVASWRILPTGSVLIDIAPGTYTFDEPIHMSHPDGNRIFIVGGGDLGAVTLEFPDLDGFVVDHGGHAYLEGLVISGNDLISTSGVYATRGAVVELIDVRVEDFYFGVHADPGGLIWAQSVVASSCSDGFSATGGYLMFGPNVSAEGNFMGYRSTQGGMIVTLGATGSGNDFVAAPDPVDISVGWNLGPTL